MEVVTCARNVSVLRAGTNETSSDYEPCRATVVGGLYTLNCGSSEGSAVADAAVGDADVDGLLLESLLMISGAVDARVGAGLLGVDIGLSYTHTCARRYRCRTPVSSARSFPSSSQPFGIVRAPCVFILVFITFIIRTYTSNWGGPPLDIMHSKKILSFLR